MRIILLRHAESLGNVDELAYCRAPDHSLPLTPRGEDQAKAAGPAVRELIDRSSQAPSGRSRSPCDTDSLASSLMTAPVAAYVSPYVRTQRTLELLDVADLLDRTVPEPRLREQDWGNLQDPAEQEVQKRRRHEFGHFYYRLAHGESGADVDDRVASFLSDLELRIAKDPMHPNTVLVVSHGLTMRLLCRRMFAWSIDLFESLSNPAHCAVRILKYDGANWRLDEPFEQWRDSPDGTTQWNG